MAICAVVLAITAAGCGNSSATPTPTATLDPNEILTRSISQMETASTVHFEGTLAGSINASALGALSGGSLPGLSGSLKIDSAPFSGDVDMTKQALHVSASFPTLFGATAEVILVDGYAYTKNSLQGGKYKKAKVTPSLLMASAAPDATFNFTDTLNQLKSRLDSVGATATLAGQDKVEGRDAYHLIVTVPADRLSEQIEASGRAVASGLALDLTPVDYWVYVDSLQPAKLKLAASSATIGNVNVTLTLSGYGQPVTIQAPPDSQVEGG